MLQHEPAKTVAEVFDLAIEIETRAGNLYRDLAVMFAHEPAVSAFWGSLKEDEDGHVETLRSVLAGFPPEKAASVADQSIWIKLVDMKRRIERCSPEEFETLDDAYEVAHELEYSEVNGIFTLLASGLPSKATVMTLIDLNIDKHQSRLIEFTREFGGRDWRQTIHSKRP